MLLAKRAAHLEAEAEAANAKADLSSTEALISYLKLEIEKLRRQLYGSRSERKARLLEQMELQLEDLEVAATEDELVAEKAADRTQTVQSFQRRRPSRKPFPGHLPRERTVIPACAAPAAARRSWRSSARTSLTRCASNHGAAAGDWSPQLLGDCRSERKGVPILVGSSAWT
jgi:multidrug efflux pump subunit AcrA (membrane-fusion protein)